MGQRLSGLERHGPGQPLQFGLHRVPEASDGLSAGRQRLVSPCRLGLPGLLDPLGHLRRAVDGLFADDAAIGRIDQSQGFHAR
jgi:hypothetical protein